MSANTMYRFQLDFKKDSQFQLLYFKKLTSFQLDFKKLTLF